MQETLKLSNSNMKSWEKALAELSALLVLKKKRIFFEKKKEEELRLSKGSYRNFRPDGGMWKGARQSKVCSILGIDERTMVSAH